MLNTVGFEDAPALNGKAVDLTGTRSTELLGVDTSYPLIAELQPTA